MQDHYIEVNGIKTRYWEEGSGDVPLILVHGLAASVEYWEENIQALAKNRRVIAMDLIGFGLTDKPKICYDSDAFVNFLKSFLAQLNIESFYLIGHSLGGSVCAQFAMDSPGRVKKLILTSSAGFDKQLPLLLRLGSLPLLGKLLDLCTRDVFAKVIRGFSYNPRSFSDDLIDRLFHLRKLPNASYAVINVLKNHVNVFGIRKRLLARVREGMSNLNMPVLIVWGKDDPLLSVRGAHKAKELIPHADIHLFDQCGHVPPLEHPEQYSQLINDFLT